MITAIALILLGAGLLITIYGGITLSNTISRNTAVLNEIKAMVKDTNAKIGELEQEFDDARTLAYDDNVPEACWQCAWWCPNCHECRADVCDPIDYISLADEHRVQIKQNRTYKLGDATFNVVGDVKRFKE